MQENVYDRVQQTSRIVAKMMYFISAGNKWHPFETSRQVLTSVDTPRLTHIPIALCLQFYVAHWVWKSMSQ